MQRVVIVNLNGIAYNLEESAYSALGAYLERAAAELRENPDRAEIVADLEQAIADKCGRFLGPHKTVVTAADMATILEEMGPVRADADGARGTTGRSAGDRTAASGQGTAAGGSSFTSKRLYRILDTGVIGGVCSGVAAYLDLDTTIVRIIVALLALFEIVFVHTPFVVLAYLIALFVVPVAGTSEERAAARGIPFNAQQLIDEAKRNFERIGERNWRREHQDRMREWRWTARQHRRAMRWTMHRPPTWPVAYGSQVAAGIMTPVLTLLSVGAFWLTVYAVMSLANTGTIRGWHLPADMPLWLGIVALLFLYGAVVWPLHAARRASYYYLGGPDFARYEAFDGLMSTILAVAIVWAAYHYRPEVREWIRHVPDAWHNVVASFKAST